MVGGKWANKLGVSAGFTSTFCSPSLTQFAFLAARGGGALDPALSLLIAGDDVLILLTLSRALVALDLVLADVAREFVLAVNIDPAVLHASENYGKKYAT